MATALSGAFGTHHRVPADRIQGDLIEPHTAGHCGFRAIAPIGPADERRASSVDGRHEGHPPSVGRPGGAIGDAYVGREPAESLCRQLLHPDLRRTGILSRHGDLRTVRRQRGLLVPADRAGVHGRLGAVTGHPDESTVAARLTSVHDRARRRNSELHAAVGSLLLDALQHRHRRAGESGPGRVEARHHDTPVGGADGQEPRSHVSGDGARRQVGEMTAGNVDDPDVGRAGGPPPEHHEHMLAPRQDFRIIEFGATRRRVGTGDHRHRATGGCDPGETASGVREVDLPVVAPRASAKVGHGVGNDRPDCASPEVHGLERCLR